MRLSPSFAAVCILVGAAASAQAQDGASLITAKGCTTCHALDQTKMGPSFKSIAAANAGKADAEATLAAELRDAKGHPQVTASEAEIHAMVAYILSLGK